MEAIMGLLDILNGMQNGPRGGQDASGTAGEKGGMSPLTMAILALLAYKAMKHVGGGQSPATDNTTAAPAQIPTGETSGGGLGGMLGNVLGGMLNGPRGGSVSGGAASGAGGLGGGLSGGLGDLLKGGLGGVLAGGAAGSVLTGGLGDLLKQFEQTGHGDTAKSWVSPGENKPIAPNDLASALGADQIGVMMQQSGLSKNELLEGLSQMLPQAIDQMTPQGRLPTEQEASRFI
jgi:uncharacterized protein YidB (DUF937 family)